MRLTLRPAQAGDEALLQEIDLCEADRREVTASTGLPWGVALAESYSTSHYKWIIRCGTQPIGVCGLALMGTYGVPWMMCGEIPRKHYISFLKGSLQVVATWRKIGQPLVNYVWDGHTTAIRWLTWLGARFDPDTRIILDPTMPFRRFDLNV